MATEVGQASIKLSFDAKSLSSSQKQVEATATAGGTASGNAWANAWTVAAGNLIAKGVAKIAAVIQDGLGDAIKRVDTMNNFPRVMQNLGIAADDAAAVVEDLSEKLIGLPTTLDGATAAVQRFTSKNGDVRKSEQIFLAVNDAILAGGMSADIQSTALEQLSQAYAKGKPDMQEWRALQTAMPAQLKQVATAMLGNTTALDKYLKKAQEYTKKNPMSSTAKELIEQLEAVKNGTGDMTTALGTALRTGIISMDQFTDTMIEMDKTGIAGFASLSEQARAATGGIETSLTNLKTAVVRAISNVIQSIGQERINRVIQGLIDSVNNIGKAVANVANFVIDNSAVIIPVITAIGTALAGAFVVDKVVKFGAALAALSTTVAGPAGVVVAVAALVVELAMLVNATDDVGSRMSHTYKVIEEANGTLSAHKQEWREIQAAQKEQVSAGLSELAYYQSLANELSNIADENGKVREGYEGRAKFITSTLKDALGVEIEYTDGIIKGYSGIKDSIDDLIASKKAKIILDSQEEAYNTAVQRQIELRREMAKVNQEVLTKYREMAYAQQQYDIAVASGTQDEIRAAKECLNIRTREYENLNSTLNNQKELYKEYTYTIGLYEENAAKFHEGKYDEMSTATWDYVNQFKDAENQQKAILEDQIKETQYSLDNLENLYRETGNAVYKQQIEDERKRLDSLKDSMSQYNSTTENELGKVLQSWGKNLDDIVFTIGGKKVELKQAGDGSVHAYIEGVDSGKADVNSEGKTIGQALADAVREKKAEADSAGQAIIDGVHSGIGNQQKRGGVVSSIASFASSIINKFKSTLGINSPSKVTTEFGKYLDEGLGVGIEKNQKAVITKAREFSEKVASAMTENTSGLAVATPEGSLVSDHSSVLEQVFEAEFAAEQESDYAPKQPLNISLELDGQQIQRVFLQDIRRSTI